YNPSQRRRYSPVVSSRNRYYDRVDRYRGRDRDRDFHDRDRRRNDDRDRHHSSRDKNTRP
ncbi:unnamed protein product, partial [Rotaria magnacalcarata]